MELDKDSDNQIIAVETFTPDLIGEYAECYNALVKKLTGVLAANRVTVIKKEISDMKKNEESVEGLKYMAVLSVLIDLSQQGWVFDIIEEKLVLKMETDNIDDKKMLRYRLSAERNAQFKIESVAKFIHRMEEDKKYKDEYVSVKSLIGDPKLLLNRIKKNERVCEPYIQLATSDRDEFTGYRLLDIWRYFRYTWSIPYKTMPGRNLYYLVRDSLQPKHPVIGIFALGNSVLNLTVRDDDIGWTVEAIKKNMTRRVDVSFCKQSLSETNGKTVKVKVERPIETKEEFEKRITDYADKIYPLLLKNITTAINDLYVKDLGYHRQTRYPRREQVNNLLDMAAEYAKKSINNKNNETDPDWEVEAQTNLFKRKRASELAKLLSTKIIFNNAKGKNNKEKLLFLLSNEEGKKAINTALIANRKCKIGSNMMDRFFKARDRIVPYRKRLQDAPMLQVLAKHAEFEEYIRSYERLLLVINEDFPKIWNVAASNAKAIINAVMSVDYVFIVGENKLHALPTPLHPLYLWKYVELAKEILSSKSVDNIEEGCLSEEDKSFIIRKAEDIPDPLSVMLLPVTVTGQNAAFLPLAGRIGMLPVYSNVPQINQSESGIDTLKQAIVRYICLYPHANMMLRICFIDPPSVEVLVSMLKALNADREFNINGIEITIFRTKEVPESWIEIDDSSLNQGMLGKYKGKRSLKFKLKIVNKRRSYNQILSELSTEQHLFVVFDPNEVKIETAQNNSQIHIHPLCVPKIYKYNPINEEVEIRPASEGGIFTIYASIIEKLNEHPSTFSHTSTFFRTPLKRETYAMEEDLLCPFHYFGITDLDIIADAGKSSEEKVENFRYLTSEERVENIMKQAEYFGYSGDRVKGLIFCSRIDEAKELLKKFNAKGWRTLVLSGSDSEEARAVAIERLAGEEFEDALDYIISVDIFSEGVDVPEINQVIMLRPTESPIVFIQQLGRGLRKAENKEYVVVLDFIGNYRNNFMIPIALSGDRSYNKDNIRRYVTEGGRVIPGASTIHFDEISRKRIFQAIDNANFSDIKLIRENYTNLKNKLGHIPALADFDKYGEMDVLRIFDNNSLGSYYKFLVKYEKEYTIRLSEDEEKAIEFISKKLASGKRIHELELLKRTLQYRHGIIGRLQKHLSEKYHCEMDEHCTENVVNMMTNEFPTSAAKKTYAQCVFLKKEQDDYGISDVYGKMLENPEFCAILEERKTEER